MIDRYSLYIEDDNIYSECDEKGQWVSYTDAAQIEQERDTLKTNMAMLSESILTMDQQLSEKDKRIALLEDSLRIAENELKELRYMRESLEK